MMFLRKPANVVAAVATLALVVVNTGDALAESSLSAPQVTNGELVVDRTATLSTSGFFDPGRSTFATSVRVDINPASMPCAADDEINQQRRVTKSESRNVSEGAFANAVVNWTPESPGSYLLCGYLTSFDVRTIAAPAVPVTVRLPNTALQLSLPARRFEENVMVPLTTVASSEVRRFVTVEVNPVGVACGPNVEANPDRRMWIWDDEIVGGPTTRIVNAETPFIGHFHLCGYVGTGITDPVPTTVIDGPDFWAGAAKCRFGAAPRRPSGRLKVTCTNTDGPIRVTALRGSRKFSTTAVLAAGKGFIRGHRVGLRRGARVSLTASVDGIRAGSRVVRVRPSR